MTTFITRKLLVDFAYLFCVSCSLWPSVFESRLSVHYYNYQLFFSEFIIWQCSPVAFLKPVAFGGVTPRIVW